MDPNACLAEIRQLIAESYRLDKTDESLSPIATDRLVELIEGLDQWISRGGFLPKQWVNDDLRRTRKGVR